MYSTIRNAVTAAFLPMFMAATSEAASQAASQAAEAKRQSIAKHEFDEETGEYEVDFSNGQKLAVNAFTDFSDNIKRRLMFHGLRQKSGDSYAGAKGNAAVAFESVKEVFDQLKNDEWKGAREGEARPRLGELAEAIANLKDIPLDQAKEAVERTAALDGDEAAKKAGAKKLAEWRAHPLIKAKILQLRSEKAQKELEANTAAAQAPIVL